MVLVSLFFCFGLRIVACLENYLSTTVNDTGCSGNNYLKTFCLWPNISLPLGLSLLNDTRNIYSNIFGVYESKTCDNGTPIYENVNRENTSESFTIYYRRSLLPSLLPSLRSGYCIVPYNNLDFKACLLFCENDSLYQCNNQWEIPVLSNQNLISTLSLNLINFDGISWVSNYPILNGLCSVASLHSCDLSNVPQIICMEGNSGKHMYLRLLCFCL